MDYEDIDFIEDKHIQTALERARYEQNYERWAHQSEQFTAANLLQDKQRRFIIKSPEPGAAPHSARTVVSNEIKNSVKRSRRWASAHHKKGQPEEGEPAQDSPRSSDGKLRKPRCKSCTGVNDKKHVISKQVTKFSNIREMMRKQVAQQSSFAHVVDIDQNSSNSKSNSPTPIRTHSPSTGLSMSNSPNSCPNHPFRKHLISCEPSEKSKHKTEYFCILCKQPVANVGYVPPRNSPTEIHNTYLLDNSSVISDHNGEWSPKVIDKSRSLDQIDYVKQYYDSLPLADRKSVV